MCQTTKKLRVYAEYGNRRENQKRKKCFIGQRLCRILICFLSENYDFIGFFLRNITQNTRANNTGGARDKNYNRHL